MKKLIFALPASALSGLSLISNSALAETLYRIPGGGLYGGDAYQDSSGNYYDDDPLYPGSGLYGGGTIVSVDGTVYDCDTSGYCTP